MRITKKVASVVLAILMVATMMSVMAVSASAAGESFEITALGTGATGAVGDQFVNLNDAIQAAGDNGSVKLIADIEFDGNSSPTFVSSKNSTTFDLNGHTITSNQTAGINLSSTLPGVVTFTVKDTSAAQTGEIITTVRYTGNACISGNTGREIVIESGKFTSDGKALYVEGKGATINGGTFDGDIYGTAPVEINDGTINGDVTVEGTGFYFDAGWSSHSEPSTATITGGTIDGDVIQNAASNAITISGGTISGGVVPAAGSDSVTVTGGTIAKTYVARIGSTGYETLQAALTAAQAGDTITLLSDITATITDIEINKNLTIDFGTYTYTAARWPFINNATLTFNGTTGGVSSSRGIVDNYGTLIINGGVYNEANVRTPAIWNNPNSELVVNGGTINSTHATIYSENGAVTTINDGVLNSTSSSKTDGVNYSYAVRCLAGSTTTVNGGTITGVHGGIVAVGDGGNTTTLVINDATITTHNSELGNDAFYPIYVSGNNTSVTVKDGTFSGPRAAAMLDDNDIGLTENTSLVIEGGTFTSPANVQAVSRGQNDSYPGVSGGTFSSAVPVAYCAEDYYPVSDGSGNYTVDSLVAPSANNTEVDATHFGLGNITFNDGSLLGVQLKGANGYDEHYTSESGQEKDDRDLRFVAAIDTELLKAAEDYGFVLAKADDTKGDDPRTCDNTNFDGIKYNGGNGEKTLSAWGTKNNIAGAAYGDPDSETATEYKFVTCAVNNIESGKKIVARFFVKVNGKVYYMNYTNDHNDTFSGCVAGISGGSIY